MGFMAKVKLYAYGACANHAGEIRAFFVRDGRRMPIDVQEMHWGEMTHEEAAEKAEGVARKLRGEPEPQAVPKEEPPVEDLTIRPGRVAMHDDGSKQHLAIIVETQGDYAKALFFTSNPHWGDKIRRAKLEELAHVGFVSSTTTYLAGVTRRTDEFYALPQSVPETYIGRYAREFQFNL